MTEKADIRSYIDELEPAIGRIRPTLDRKALLKLFSTRSGSSERGDYQGMIFFIAHSMGLFDNQVIVVGQFVDAKAPNGSPIWVSAPSEKADYHPPDKRKTRVKVCLNNAGLSHWSFERAVVGIARELSRVVLFMSGHRLREKEKAADLVAMMLGYRPFYTCEAERAPRPAGHLDVQEISLAASYIEEKQKSAGPGRNGRVEQPAASFESIPPIETPMPIGTKPNETTVSRGGQMSTVDYLAAPNFAETDRSPKRLKPPSFNEKEEPVAEPRRPSSIPKMPDVW
jgi:hypothetical protein